jgi:hypothetical protein
MREHPDIVNAGTATGAWACEFLARSLTKLGVAEFADRAEATLRSLEKTMRTIIGTVTAVAALGLAVSVVPAAAQHHGGPSIGGHAMGGAPAMGHAIGGAPSMGASPHFSGPSTSGFASSPNNFSPNRGNFAPSRGAVAAPNNGMAWNNWGRRGDRGHDFRGRRHFGPGFAFGFGFPYYGDDYAYDYGPDYASDYGYDYGDDYGNTCYAVRRVYSGGYWHIRRVWICG